MAFQRQFLLEKHGKTFFLLFLFNYLLCHSASLPHKDSVALEKPSSHDPSETDLVNSRSGHAVSIIFYDYEDKKRHQNMALSDNNQERW